MVENIRLSFKGIWTHKMRSFLTMLGIIIGIASIIIIVSLIQGTNKQIEENLIGDGSHTVDIVLTENGMEINYLLGGVPHNLNVSAENAEDIAAFEHVVSASAYYKRDYYYDGYYNNVQLNGVKILGIDTSYVKTAGYSVIAGRGVTEEDQKSFRKICLVNEPLAISAFGGKNPVGETLDISGECFTVAGVISKKSTFEPVIESMEDYRTYMKQETGTVYIPSALWPSAFIYDEPSNFLVKASSVQTMTSVGNAVSDYLNQNLGEQESGLMYTSLDLASQAARLQNLGSSTNFLMIGIAAISLLVGGIGVMNIMLVSVTERTREIGLKKALGAKKRVILGQFLTEAALLSAMGGFLGVVLGIILAKVISMAAMIPVSISVPAILVSVAFSMAIGIVFGLAPSMKAANLNPIDALRYE
ncbi:MAG: ABC transporter permease [Lachnospiraceae bacterium]|nr:ABC transporter permease [Lachnospiraceae bacterium]